MRAILPLLALPVIIGLVAFVAGMGDEFVPFVISILKYGAILIAIFLILRAMLPKSVPTDVPLFSEDHVLDKPQGGVVTYLSTNLVRLDTKEGTAFLVYQKGKNSFRAQQITPSGLDVGEPFVGNAKQIQMSMKSRSRRR